MKIGVDLIEIARVERVRIAGDEIHDVEPIVGAQSFTL